MPVDASERKRRVLRLYDAISVFALAVLFLAVSTTLYRWNDHRLHDPQRIAEEFHQNFYYASEQTWRANRCSACRWKRALSDTWTLQEIIYETRPDVIVEAGTWKGGSALFMPRLWICWDAAR